MRIIATHTIGLLMAAGLTLPAAAADIITGPSGDAPMTAPQATGYNWNGFYLGVGGGSGAVVHNINVIGIDIIDGIGGEGMFGEVTAGYDHMISDRMLIGAFASYRMGNIATELDVDILGTSLNYDLVATNGFDLGARLGFAIAPSTLAYLTGGYTHQTFEADGSFGLDYEFDTDGYFAGAGLETVISGNWTAKAEYRFSQYREEGIDPFGLLSATPSIHAFHAGINYRFGGGSSGGSATFAPVAYDFSGFKVVAAGGFGAVVHQIDVDLSPFPVDASFNGIGGEGMFGEIGVVYDFAFAPKWVAGIGADYRMGNIATDIDLSILGDGAITADNGYDVYGRLGYEVNPGTLVYGLAGLSWQNFDVSFDSALLPPGIVSTIEDLGWSTHGWTVGAGIETAVSDRWTAKIEYRYAEYDSHDLLKELDSSLADIVDITPSTHTVRAGLSYKFF